jgi:hypothetical protein
VVVAADLVGTVGAHFLAAAAAAGTKEMVALARIVDGPDPEV